MCLSFLGAGYLINKSYSSWQKSPISTTVTTLPISDLDFPKVTVCPPKGSQTALNFDLMKADSNSLTDEDRDDLTSDAAEIFVESQHQDYIRNVLAASNLENVKQMFKGFQSFPRQILENTGYEVRMWNNHGSIHTPWFGEDYSEDFFKEDKNHHIILQFPDDLSETVGAEMSPVWKMLRIRELFREHMRNKHNKWKFTSMLFV